MFCFSIVSFSSCIVIVCVGRWRVSGSRGWEINWGASGLILSQSSSWSCGWWWLVLQVQLSSLRSWIFCSPPVNTGTAYWPCSKCMDISFSTVDLNTAGLEVVYGLVCWISHINTCFSSVFLRGFFHLNPETLMPDDEKQRLIDNMEGETTEKSILIEKWWCVLISLVMWLYLVDNTNNFNVAL